QALVVPDVAEHWLDGGKAPSVGTAPVRAVDPALHALRGRLRSARCLATDEGDLSTGRLVGVAQALRAQRTLQAYRVRSAVSTVRQFSPVVAIQISPRG